MRGLVLLAVLAGAFGLAAWWQQRHLGELRAAQAAIEAETDGQVHRTPSGPLGPGEAVLIVGRPSGVEPRPRPQREAPQPAAPEPTQAPMAPAPALADYTHEVQPGQTLSGIAHVHYGRLSPVLLEALADYNGLEQPDRLRVGQVLRLPPLATLEAARQR